ncbi:MAG: hypothetical protein R3C10_04435 [Pirellulales bacterium]
MTNANVLHRYRCGPRRLGFTLVEMLVATATTSVICTLAVSLMVAMFRAEQLQSRDVQQRGAIQRLGGQFRRDVHAAWSVEPPVPDDETLLRLALGDVPGDGVVVTYRRVGTSIVREVQQSDNVARRETFTLSKPWLASVDTPSGETPVGLLRLSFDCVSELEHAAAPLHWRFEAALGADHRLDSLTAPTREMDVRP